MAKKPLIVVIGSLNVDFVTTTPRVPEAGETLTATSLKVHAGGKGANQAVACGRASFTSKNDRDVDVAMFGAVGKGDPYYASLLQPTLEESGVDTKWVRKIEESQTGTATILVEESGENRIMVVPGANHEGMSDHAFIIGTIEAPTDSEHAIRGRRTPDVVVMQGEIPRLATIGLLDFYNKKHRKTKVIFNPAPVFPEGVPKEALEGLAVLVVNQNENDQLLRGLGKSDQVTTNTNEHCEMSCKIYHEEYGIEIVLITLGQLGAFYSTSAGLSVMVDAVKVSKVVDTTAAGDTFVGTIAAGIARSKSSTLDLPEIVRKANVAAAKTVQISGAMASIPFGYET